MRSEIKKSYRMPAEWEPHSAIWLAWPYDEVTFPGRVEKAEAAFVNILGAIHMSERAELLVLDEGMKERSYEMLAAEGVDMRRIHFHVTDYADVWLRDTGPIFVKDGTGKTVITKWLFNAWGNKFPELLRDSAIPDKIGEWKNLHVERPGIIVEGGAIDVNGGGMCLTTEQCLLNENRNPGKSQADVEMYLGEYLGIRKTVWLREGLVNDHTDGHIDELARFVAPGRIVCAYEDDPGDENYGTLQANYSTLTGAADTNGNPFDVVKLPMPHVRYEDGQKAPVSYTNFYIGNTVVLAPTFGDENDEKALEILRGLFPGREVAGIDCSDIIYGGGALHCVTQQEPE
jgi:agmatine deiminase